MKRINLMLAVALPYLLSAMILSFVSCSGGLDIQQDYGFTLETMPVQKSIAEGETVEIRCALLREGDFDGARYYIRYFQPDGAGELRLEDGTLLSPNNIYPLEKTVFRLYFTSRSPEQQTIDVYIEDNAGQVVMRSFAWQNEGTGNDENENKE